MEVPKIEESESKVLCSDSTALVNTLEYKILDPGRLLGQLKSMIKFYVP